MGLLDEIFEECELFIEVEKAVEVIAEHQKESILTVATYLLNKKTYEHIAMYERNDFHQFNCVDDGFQGTFQQTYSFLTSILDSEVIKANFNSNWYIIDDFDLLDKFKDCYWLKSDFYSFEPIRKLDINEDFYKKFIFNNAKKFIKKLNNSSSVIAPDHIKKLFSKNYFSVADASLFIHSNKDENNDYHFDEYPSKYSIDFIMDGIEQGDIKINEYETIPKMSLQEFLYKRDYRIVGFSDNLPVHEPVDCGQSSIEQTSPNTEHINAEITELRKVVMEKTKNIEELQEQIAELEAKQMQFFNNQNAIIDDKINLRNNDLLFIAALVKMLSSEKRVYTQSKILEMIEDNHKGIKGLSKSRTEKLLAAANKIYKPLIRNKIK